MERTPTFGQLAKIYWAMIWRQLLAVFAIVIGAVFFIALFASLSSESELLIALMFIISGVGILWWSIHVWGLITNKTYSDFELTVVDKKTGNKITPTFGMNFGMAWAYFWRSFLAGLASGACFGLLVFILMEAGMREMAQLMSIASYGFGFFIGIGMLKFVVNKDYSTFRLSLTEL